MKITRKDAPAESREDLVQTQTANTSIISVSASHDLPLPGRTIIYTAKAKDKDNE